MNNEYGLDVSYVRKKLRLVLRDLDRYTPDELFRELDRISRSQLKREVWIPSFVDNDGIKMYSSGDYYETKDDCLERCERLVKITKKGGYEWVPSLEIISDDRR